MRANTGCKIEGFGLWTEGLRWDLDILIFGLLFMEICGVQDFMDLGFQM